MKQVVLAEYFTTADFILLFIVRVDLDKPVVVRIEKPLDELRDYVGTRFSTVGQASKLRDLDPDDWRAYSQPLIKPILEWTDAGDILWLVPHDVLHYLPLHAIPLDSGYLIERNPVCYTPSASVMKYCRTKRKERQEHALVLGDSLGNLPFSRAEAQRVATLFGVIPHLGRQASKELLTAVLEDESQCQAIDVLHLACHGSFEADQALKSGIELAAASGSERLTAAEIFGLKLNADLVTLSACQSGISQRWPGDELIGLVRALIYAGTPSVLVSLWSVDDLSTGLLMERFYHGWRAGLNKAEALQAAQCWLRKLSCREILEYVTAARDAAKIQVRQGDSQAVRLWQQLDYRREELLENYSPDAHPLDAIFYWAPFMLVGDWH